MAEAKDLRRIRKGCTNKTMRELILGVIRDGARYRMTKSGVMILGATGGGVATHFTCSDHRAPENFRKSLKHIGITTTKGT